MLPLLNHEHRYARIVINKQCYVIHLYINMCFSFTNEIDKYMHTYLCCLILKQCTQCNFATVICLSIIDVL